MLDTHTEESDAGHTHRRECTCSYMLTSMSENYKVGFGALYRAHLKIYIYGSFTERVIQYVHVIWGVYD